MFLIIGIWGSGPRKIYSVYKFFLFTLLEISINAAAIIFIYWSNGTTDYTEIIIKITRVSIFLWLAFFSSFAVKTPYVAVHTWLPDAHVEAPTAGSVILAAITFKNGRIWFFKIFLRNVSYRHQNFLLH